MNNERDSLCAFRLRIATFDSGWANAAAEQDALHRKEGGRCPPYKNYRPRYPLGRSLHIAIVVIIHFLDRYKKSTPKAGAQCAPYKNYRPRYPLG